METVRSSYSPVRLLVTSQISVSDPRIAALPFVIASRAISVVKHTYLSRPLLLKYLKAESLGDLAVKKRNLCRLT